MSPLRLTGSTSGYSQLNAPAVAGDQTFTLPGTGGTIVTTAGTQTLTNKTIQGGTNTLATAVASTSGTSIDFTGIPSWVNRITVMLDGVSTNGTSNPLIQVGDSGGVETSGYASSSVIADSVVVVATYTAGFGIRSGNVANSLSGHLILTLRGSNAWICSGTVSAAAGAIFTVAGTKALSDILDRVRITTVNGTDTFDAGTINILYEG